MNHYRVRRIHIVVTIAGILCLLGLGSPTLAKTLEWDRNSETDMKEYRVYLCLTKGCTATKTATPTATVPHPGSGIIPSWRLPENVEGAAVVTALDVDGNESPVSNLVNFETKAPAAPTNARVK